MLLFVSVLLTFFLPSSYLFDPDLTGTDLYGPMLVARQHVAISIVDRSTAAFALYRPYNSSQFCTFTIPGGIYVMQLSIPSNGSAAPNEFYYQGLTPGGGSYLTTITRVTFSMSPCGYSVNIQPLPASPLYDYSTLGAPAMGHTIFYMANNFTFSFDYNTVNGSDTGERPGSIDSTFVYYTIDIVFNGWGVIAGAIPINNIYVPTLYLISLFPTIYGTGYNYAVQDRWMTTFTFPWQSIVARRQSGSTEFDPVYSMSLSINNAGDILFGVQSMNTVFHLYVDPANPSSFVFKSSRIYSITVPSIGFGKGVGWLDNTTPVILANNVSLDYTQWSSSRIEIYDLSNGQQLNNTQNPYSSFPTTTQSMYSLLTGPILLMVATYAGSVIFVDSTNDVYVILPSPPGYYSATNVGNTYGAFVYFSSVATCPQGTYNQGFAYGKYLFDTCIMCPEGTYSPGSANLTAGCLPCDTTQYFCPIGAVAAVPLSYMTTISQAVAFPKSPENTEFADILLLNMFNTNFETNCLTTTPFFWTLIMAGTGLIFLIIMGLIKLSGKYGNYRTKVESVFKHFDIISGGERWVGGVLSFTIVVIIIFAALFTNSFIKQYPQATSRAPEFTCDETLRNSQFSSQMQSLGAAVSGNMTQLFNLLQLQKFTLIVTLLNTIVNTNVIVSQTIGTITTKLNIDLSTPTNGCLVISCNLTSNIATININVSSMQTIGGISIGLSGPGTTDRNIEAKDLNFSNTFSMTNRTMSQEPYFSVELIQVINETKPLSLTDASQFSGLWIPTFTTDEDQNFYVESDYEKYHTKYYTILTIDITQAAYYIYNEEKPIIKTTSVIFKNILFVSMCMEIIAFIFLMVKLVIGPLLQFIVRLTCSKEKESEEKIEHGDEGESEKEEVNESDSDDDVGETPRKIKLEPGLNEFYMPDVKI